MRKLLLFLFVLGFFLNGANLALAGVSVPYVVDDVTDEKPRVLFGDSATISATSTYQGLENYTADYVNNYLHITFTYTHNKCCTASYPPFLYITDTDPRATTTATVRLSPNAVYLLSSIPIPPGHETDWYAYDVQFDATGFIVVV
ncbi:MAG: hypothetical protein Q7S54_00375, partial [bacterium]|nr:hypothetical protein [bacterium]